MREFRSREDLKENRWEVTRDFLRCQGKVETTGEYVWNERRTLPQSMRSVPNTVDLRVCLACSEILGLVSPEPLYFLLMGHVGIM